jgi:uncharacterized MAPEG superfamily protein
MATFPTELGILTCLAILAASLWIPFIAGSSNDPAATDGFNRPHDLTALRPWVHRAFRAHMNLLEQLLPFATLVLILDRIDGFTALTFWTAIAFFWIRIAHAVGMITGIAGMPLRPIIFVAGYVCVLLMAYSVFAARIF